MFDRYEFDDAYADALVAVLQDTFDRTIRNHGGIVRLMKRILDAGATHEVDVSRGVDSTTVRTIHAAKGLEHPIVILVNVNQYSFHLGQWSRPHPVRGSCWATPEQGVRRGPREALRLR